MISAAHQYLKNLAILTLFINAVLLLWGILGDPGIHKATYLHYTKLAYSGKQEHFTDDSDEDQSNENEIEMTDVESKSQTKQNQV